MGSKANPTVIGAFVVGAVVLIVAALLIFSGGNVLTKKALYVMYFDSSVNGLSVGAPVKFKGVQIGEVSNIVALANPQNLSILIEVVIEILPEKFTDQTTRQALSAADNRQAATNALIQKGLRASLQLQSMVTGLLFIELDFRPDTPVKLLGLNKDYVEVPTAPSAMGALMANVKKAVAQLDTLPLNEIMDEIVAILKRVKHLIDAPQMDDAMANLGLILQESKTGLQQLFEQIPAVVKQIDTIEDEAVVALRDARLMLKDAQTLVRNVNTQVAPLSSKAQGALTAARSALQQGQKSIKDLETALQPALGQADQALTSVAHLTGSDSVILNDLSQALREIAEAARSIRVLANALERNPESLIRGKGR